MSISIGRVQIKVTDGSALILASYNTTQPTSAQSDMQHTLVSTQPVVIQSRDPRPLTIAVRTGGGVLGSRTCNGNVTVSVDLLNARIRGRRDYKLVTIVFTLPW